MRILVVTNLYPTEERPFVSPFVKEQVESMRECFPDLTIDVRVIEGARPRWGYLRDIFLLPIIVMKGKYDIVHAHFGLTLISTLFVRVPIVITFHGSDLLIRRTGFVSRLLAPKASKAIVVAQRLKESLGYGEVIPCGIEVKKFSLPSSYNNKPYPIKPGKLKVLFPSDPARIIKNYDLFQAVCQELETLGYEIEEINLVNIDRSRVQEVYWESDLMLLTSISEGSPTIVKEAIAAKLPFVSVDVGDVSEWVTQIDFGDVVYDREPCTIADAVVMLLAKINNRASLDITQSVEKIGLTNAAHQIRHIYEKVLK